MPLSGHQILEEMSALNMSWLWYAGKRNPECVLDTPTQAQVKVLRAFGRMIGEGGVLQECDG